MVEHVSPRKVLEALQSNPQAELVDVRTEPEWSFVGIPDLARTGKRLVMIPWQIYPDMRRNNGFVQHLQEAGLTPEHHIYFLCRSGQRSLAAAQAAQGAGFPHAYNVADGFEGALDGAGHRGVAAGWKAEGLPWRQS